LNQSGHAV